MKRFTSVPPARRALPALPDVIDALAVAALTLVALWSFRSSYGGIQFMVLGAVALVIGLVLAHVARLRDWPLLVIIVSGTVGYVVVATLLALRHHAIAGFIPSPRSAFEALASSATAWKELITTAPPVGTTGDLMVIPVLLGYVSGFIGLSIASRVRFAAPVLLAPLMILALGIAVGVDTPVSVIANGAVLALLMVAWMSWREQRRRPMRAGGTGERSRLAAAAAVLLVAGGLGYLVGPSLPGDDGSREIWRQTVVPPFDPRVYPSPLAGYRAYVKPGVDSTGQRNEAEVMFDVVGLPADVPIRLATMDSYDGLVWQVSGGDLDNPSLQDSGSFERIGARIDPDFDGEIGEVAITIREYEDVWIPTVGEVISLRFEGSEGGADRDRELAETFRYNRATDTAATPVGLRNGDRYVMKVVIPETREKMAGEPVVPKLPQIGSVRSVTAVTQALSTPDLLVVDDAGSRLDQITDLMSSTGAYSDGDRESNQQQSRAGHSEARLTAFAGEFPRVPFIGNAEQYAATYALLFRDLGNLPTRVVMGFQPSGPSLTEPVAVLQTEVEAWVEVPIEGAGWVAIMPTPPRDQITSTSSSPQQPEPDYRTQNPPPPPLLDPEFDQPAKAAGDAQSPRPDAGDEADAPTPTEDPGPSLLASSGFRLGAAIVSPFLLLIASCGLIVLLKWIRRRRRKERGEHHQRIANGWREVTDLCTDLGQPIPSATTRKEASVFAGATSTALAERTDRTVWSGTDLTDDDVEDYWVELQATLKAMRTEAGSARGIRSFVSVQSLKRDRIGRRSR